MAELFGLPGERPFESALECVRQLRQRFVEQPRDGETIAADAADNARRHARPVALRSDTQRPSLRPLTAEAGSTSTGVTAWNNDALATPT